MVESVGPSLVGLSSVCPTPDRQPVLSARQQVIAWGKSIHLIGSSNSPGLGANKTSD